MALCAWDKELVWSYREEKEWGWQGGKVVYDGYWDLNIAGGGKWGCNGPNTLLGMIEDTGRGGEIFHQPGSGMDADFPTSLQL